jgi:Na+-transporting methylmalonyl-CoA/oxaloacetate decarboxylase gamma subunit
VLVGVVKATTAARWGTHTKKRAHTRLSLRNTNTHNPRNIRSQNKPTPRKGWYQSAVLGSYQTVELIDTFVNYHESIKKCVCLVYDPQRSARGTTALRAIRLKPSFIEAYKVRVLPVACARCVFFCVGAVVLLLLVVVFVVRGGAALPTRATKQHWKSNKQHSQKQQPSTTNNQPQKKPNRAPR